MRANSNAPSSWLSTEVAAEIGFVWRHAETLQPAFDFVFPFLKGASRRAAEHLGLRRCFQRRGRDRASFPIAGLFQIGRHAARNPGEEYYGVLGGLGGLGDGLPHGFAGQRQRGLADFLLALGKWKYSEPRGDPPAARMSCSAVP